LIRGNKINLHDGVGFIGTYTNGRAEGKFWIGMKGDGYMHGEENNQS